MSETRTPTYVGEGDTFLDVLPAPADARRGSVLLNVSGYLLGLGPLPVLRMIDLLAECTPGSGITFWCSETDEGPYLDLMVREREVGISIRYDTSRVTHHVAMPHDRAHRLADEIADTGIGGGR